MKKQLLKKVTTVVLTACMIAAAIPAAYRCFRLPELENLEFTGMQYL